MGLNWSEGLRTLGEGLQRFAGVRLQKESEEIERMRQDAIARLNREHDVSMAERREKHDLDLFEKGERAAGIRDAARDKAQADRDTRLFGQQAAMMDRRTIADALEQNNRDYSQRMTTLQNHKKALDVKKAELSAQGFSDPAGMSAFDDLYAAIEEEAKQARQNYILTQRRIQSGGYGKVNSADVLSEDDVAALFADKPANTDAPIPAPEVAAEPAAASQPAPSRQPAAPAAAPAQSGDELFPQPTSITELIGRNQQSVRGIPPRPSFADMASRVGSTVLSAGERNRREAEERRKREEYWRQQATP